jgi:acylphosphatase
MSQFLSPEPRVFVPKTWEALQEVLFHDSWNPEIGRFRSSYIYRGMNDASQTLNTSLQRLGGDYPKLERHLLRNFKKYAHRDAASGNSVWNWLAVAQHHGLPTRLLDWTYSPYVALHFATNELEHYDKDAVIWALNYVALNQFLPKKLKKIIEKEASNTFTAEMLDQVCTTLDDLDQRSEEEFLLFLEPPSLDSRITNQFALFSLLSDARTTLESWLLKHPECFFKIILPKELKWEIRDKLDQANITERVLMPGLDGLSAWLKRHYSASNITQPNQNNLVNWEAVATGKVQGVGYRAFVQKNAVALGVMGWVRNEADGSVRIKIQGPQNACETLLDLCKQGPANATVASLTKLPADLQLFDDFTIQRL